MIMTVTSTEHGTGTMSSEFRRGWLTLAFSTVGAGVGFSSLGYILGTLVVPLQEEFGWGRGQINLASLVSSLGLALALPFVGKLLDRFGVKRVCLVSLPLLVVILALLGLLTSTLAIFLTFYALAGVLGAGTSALSYSKAIVEKFDTGRGTALGIMAAGLGSAGLILPPLMGMVIADAGGAVRISPWRRSPHCPSCSSSSHGSGRQRARRRAQQRRRLVRTRSRRTSPHSFSRRFAGVRFGRYARCSSSSAGHC